MPTPLTTSDSLSGSFTSASPLPQNTRIYLSTALSYTFTDGVHVLNGTDADFFGYFSTDQTGAITDWSFDVISGAVAFFSTNKPQNSIAYDSVNIGFSGAYSTAPGSFAAGALPTATTPEPSSLLLLCTGLLGTSGFPRRKHA